MRYLEHKVTHEYVFLATGIDPEEVKKLLADPNNWAYHCEERSLNFNPPTREQTQADRKRWNDIHHPVKIRRHGIKPI